MVKALAVGIIGLFLFCWLTCEAGIKVRYKDPKVPVEERVSDLLSRMNLQEKIGQMTQIEVSTATAEIMQNYFIGGLLTGGGTQPVKDASAKYWVDMINKFQKGCMKTRLAIPMIYGIDAIHGHNNVVNATIFPHNINLGVTRDPALVKKIGEATALEVRATGIPYAFAPCVAVCRDPRWGRCFESYSEDHKIVEAMTDIVNGLQGDLPPNYPKDYPFIGGKDKVAGCAKHYIGDGGTVQGINENNTIINMRDLMAIHMPPYKLAIEKGVATIMISFSSINGVKMHANRDLISLLKNMFKGFVVSDWKAIDKITDPPGANYTYSVQTSISAGIDMIMVPDDYTSFIGNLTKLVNDKVIPMSRIDDAVTRILRVKFLLGLFENPHPDYNMVNMLGKPEHRDLAREAVRKSLVLLKNGKIENHDQPMLPLPKKAKKILVIGSHADNLGYQCGGWTLEWQGYSGNDRTSGTTILAGIENTVDPATEIMFNETADSAFMEANKDADFAIVVVGEKPYAESQGDNLNLTIPGLGQEVIRKACGSGVKCVVVLISGRPLVIEPLLQKMDAVVAVFLPGSEGQGVADVLFGDYGFRGKLARTWMRRVDQLPLNYGDRNYDPLYPFGFGLETEGALL